MHGPDNIEFLSGFLPRDYELVLRETACRWENHYLVLIGRYLAQLHRAQLLFRDINDNNIMFRASDGYPVLIDNPRPNVWGLSPLVTLGDFFAPFVCMPKPQFEALLLGYCLNAQRLIDPLIDNYSADLLASMGGSVLSITKPLLGSSFEMIAAELVLTAGTDIPFERQPSAVLENCGLLEIVWTVLLLYSFGVPARSLMSALAEAGRNVQAWRNLDSAFVVGADGSLHLPPDWQVPEGVLLDAINKALKERSDGSSSLSFAPNPHLGVVMDLAAESQGRSWGCDLAKFWIQALHCVSRALDGSDPVASIQAAQIAHVVFQHVVFADDDRLDLLQTLRCHDARRSWYWPEGDIDAKIAPHYFLFRNTEANTLSKSAFRNGAVGDPPEPFALHAAFDAIEHDRNLVGKSARLAGTEMQKPMPYATAHCLNGGITRMRRMHTAMRSILTAQPKVCYTFGWCPVDTIRALDSAEAKAFETPPKGMHDLIATANFEIGNDEGFRNRFIEWAAQIWGESWYMPFDPLGSPGFRVIIAAARNEHGVGGDIIRAGCGQVVFQDETPLSSGLRYQIIERLWPIPGRKPSGHEGAEI
ncbi:MAG TPA: hypothetical protein VG889_17965 [Rhizomicrobium sp.]|nr:hypothetical protein [Rhizomicrobium sp.]